MSSGVESTSPPRVLGYSLDHTISVDLMKGRDTVVATEMLHAKGEDGSPPSFFLEILNLAFGNNDPCCKVVVATD